MRRRCRGGHGRKSKSTVLVASKRSKSPAGGQRGWPESTYSGLEKGVPANLSGSSGDPRRPAAAWGHVKQAEAEGFKSRDRIKWGNPLSRKICRIHAKKDGLSLAMHSLCWPGDFKKTLGMVLYYQPQRICDLKWMKKSRLCPMIINIMVSELFWFLDKASFHDEMFLTLLKLMERKRCKAIYYYF